MVANGQGTMVKWNSNIDVGTGRHTWNLTENPKWRVIAGGNAIGTESEIEEVVKMSIQFDER